MTHSKKKIQALLTLTRKLIKAHNEQQPDLVAMYEKQLLIMKGHAEDVKKIYG